jgi:hypothetical protein
MEVLILCVVIQIALLESMLLLLLEELQRLKTAALLARYLNTH